MEATKHKAIRVAPCERDNACEGFSDKDWPGRCERLAASYSIERGSGYVVACREHAQDLIDNAIEAGDIYQEPVSE